MPVLDASRDPRRQILINAVAAAVMAPSSHNSQPWRFRLVGDTLELLADPRRHLTVIDPDRRQLVQSCGCALFNAQIAVRAMGHEDLVTVMPDPEQPDLLATIQVGASVITTDAERALMRAIPLRRTNRRPFASRPVALSDTEELFTAARRPGVWMGRLDPDQKRRVGELVLRADRAQYRDPAFRAELGRWLAATGSRRTDGIPFAEKEYGSVMPFSVVRALRSPGLGSEFGKLEQERVEGSPVVTVIGTAGDSPAHWLAAGQALEALLLGATTRGLAAAYLNQALEIPILRRDVTNIIDRGEHPQMILRLGYPVEGVGHPAPRRDLEDVLLIVD